MVLEGVDLRLSNDGFMLNLWPVINSNYEFSNREQVVQFLSRSIIATNAPNCGATNGWIPVKDDPAEEDYKDSYQFMACGQWEENIGFDLNVSARLINDGNVVNGYEMDFFFDNEEDFQKSFLEFKKIYQKSRAKTEVSKTGSFDYNLVNRKTGDRISSIECLNMKDKSDCGIRAIYLGSDNSQDYLAVNGNNNMIGSKVKFQEDLTSTTINSCHRYELNAGIWERVDNVFCGIGIGLSDPTDLDSTPLNYVELNVESISTNKLFLDKKCNFEDNTGAIVEMPCGVYNEDSNTTPGVTTAIAVYDEVKADLAMIGVTNAGIANISEANISNALNVAGTSNFDGNVTVNGISDFNNVVNINGEETDVNLVVNTSASLKDVDILGALNVDGIAIFEQDVDVKGDLVVDNKIEANQITLTNKISSSNLGQRCNVEDGTIVQYESAGYTDLAICANQKWKLVNIQENQIMAFDGSCPSGFEKFSKAEGRTLIGAGNLYDSDSGQTMSYSVGQVGGKAKHTLSINEMPSHSHDFRDAYWAEHWGDTGEKNKRGENGGQDNDNNYYTMASETYDKGGNQAHENMTPFYTAKYCRYSVGDKISNVGGEPPINVDDYWYPYESQYGDWYSTGNRSNCGPDEYTVVQEEDVDTGAITDVEYWVRICDMEYERIVTEKEINYLTGQIRTSGTKTENMTKSTSEAWQRGTPLIYDWYDISEPRNCKHPATNTVSSGNDFILTLYCEVDRERTYQERLVMLDSNGNPLEYRNWGEVQAEQDVFWDNYLFTVNSNDYYKICGDWDITPEENAKEWVPDAGDYDRNVNVPQTRTVEQYRVCSNKVDMFGHTYVLSTFNEYRDVDQSRTIKGSKINLKTWLENDNNGNWTVSSDGSYAYQHVNGYPTIFTTPTKDYGVGIGSVFKGWISVETTSDDDWIDFVMGKKDANNFYLWSWKQGNQSPAKKGHTFAKVTAGVGVIPWDAHNSKSGYSVLRTDLRKGWIDGKKYEFRIEYKPDNVRLFIEGELLFDIDGNFPSGAVGFYNNSQSDVKYYKITEEPYYE